MWSSTMSRNKGTGGISCTVPNCINTFTKTVSFFRFPRDPIRSKLWVGACNRVDLIGKDSEFLHRNYRLCALHFEDKYFTNHLYRNRLGPTAVPTVFLSLGENFETSNVNIAKEHEHSDEDGAKETKCFAEMVDVNKHICRLCLEVVPTAEAEIIEETNKEKLELLLINIDFDISDNAVACNRCLEKLHECFNFKSTCSSIGNYTNPFVNIDIKVDIENVSQVKTSMENVKLETACQLCMLPIEDESSIDDSIDGVLLKDIIRNFLPEVDLSTVREPLICNRCLSNAKKYKEFMNTCHEVEQRIQNYHKVMKGDGKVILEDVHQFKNCDTLSEPIIIKEEYPDVDYGEYVHVNAINYVKSEDPVSITYDEVNIKEELGIEEESAESGNCNSSGSNSVSKRKTQIRKSVSKDEKPHGYFCQKCPYSTYKSGNLKTHMLSHKDNEVHKCVLCPFVTDARILLCRHMRTHKGSTKAFGCIKCPFETNYKYELMRHFERHKDDSKVVIYQCEHCFFSTKSEKNFAYHILTHNRVFKCDKCDFQTRHKNNLKTHMLVHEDAFKYKCEMCSYESKNTNAVKRHMMTHLEDNLYSCDQCMYCTNVRRNLLNHKQVHIKESERVTLQCDKCDFQTKSKGSLKSHKLVHNPNRPTFKCDKCEYSTKKRTRLNHHLVTHMGLEEAVVYYCATCDLRTKYKDSLFGHVRICLKKRNDNNIKNKKKSCQPSNNLQKVVS